jgi:hypothetical protein
VPAREFGEVLDQSAPFAPRDAGQDSSLPRLRAEIDGNCGAVVDRRRDDVFSRSRERRNPGVDQRLKDARLRDFSMNAVHRLSLAAGLPSSPSRGWGARNMPTRFG